MTERGKEHLSGRMCVCVSRNLYESTFPTGCGTHCTFAKVCQQPRVDTSKDPSVATAPLPLPSLASTACSALLLDAAVSLFPVPARRGHLASHATPIPVHSSPAYPSSRVISFLSFFQFFRFCPAPPVIAILGPSRAETTDDFPTRNKPKRIHRRIAANSNTHVGHGGPASVIPPHPGNLNTIRDRPFPPACSTKHRQQIYRLQLRAARCIRAAPFLHSSFTGNHRGALLAQPSTNIDRILRRAPLELLR